LKVSFWAEEEAEMARKRYTREQIVAVIREAERGVDRKELFRKHGISAQTF
jgi:hypothetical protein